MPDLIRIANPVSAIRLYLQDAAVKGVEEPFRDHASWGFTLARRRRIQLARAPELVWC